MIKIGLIVDSVTVSSFEHDIVEWAKNQPGLAITHLIIQNLPPAAIGRGLVLRNLRLIRQLGLRRYLEKRLMRKLRESENRILSFTKYAGRDKAVSLEDLVEGRIMVTPLVSKGGRVHRFSADDERRIRDEGFDILLRCGTGILRGGILYAARLGVLSFHHADNRINRGLPPGFWEVYHRQPTTGFIIQKLNEELDGGLVLRRGAIPTKNSWLVNQAALYERANYHLKQLLINVAAKGELEPGEESVPYFNPLFRNPTLGVQLRYMGRMLGHRIKTRINYGIRGMRQRWGVAFARSHWRSLVMHKAVMIPNPPGRYLADPFVISKNCKDFCFVEDYDGSIGKAVISVYELHQSKAEYVGVALTEDFHLSFPYLYETDEGIFMVPETSDNGDIRIYKCLDFPLQWKLESVVMKNVSAADSMIFQKNGLWWLFTSIDPTGGKDHGSELMIYHTNDPLSGNWISHPMNPVYIDPTIGRNGGILIDGPRVYRVAHIQGFCQYGAGMRILEIDKLSPTEFEESEVWEMRPNFATGLLGTHHLHCNGSVSVFDYVKEEKNNF